MRTTTLSRARELLTGRHHVYLRLVPTISGRWAWRSTCHTCDITRAGLEPNRAAALAAAHQLIGPRDHHGVDPATKHHNLAVGDQLRAAGEHALLRWDRLRSMQLPDTITGSGYTVAASSTHNPATNTAGWAFVTDAGWCRLGTSLGTNDTTVCAETGEFAAVRRALAIYPASSEITVLVTHRAVASLLEDLDELTRVSHRLSQLPHPPQWVHARTAQDVKDLLQTRRVTVRCVSAGHDSLHRLAAAAAQATTSAAANGARWTPADLPLIDDGLH